ncbi:hypothetical protein C1645_830244 [Glomus cerebriforme]|uniref:Uncharacterized protein n=1 Tax=Glomus cerebriforme TaxID=658196 RepID=A0A397SSG2_9GLOM|nr:hypothetical protein C1645_830244 [Glomus cerebriforme]
MMKLISILIVVLFISLCNSDGKTITFYEENLIPNQMTTYSDNTVVFRLVARLDVTCNVPDLTYRILYPNGTNNLITVYDHQIPFFNFCLIDNSHDNIYFMKTIPNYIFVYYENEDDAFGMMIDWNGKIISNNLLGLKSINMVDAYVDADKVYNYFIETIENSYNIILKKFVISGKGDLVKIQEDLVQMPEGYVNFNAYITIDSEILFTFIYKSNNDILQDSILEPEWRIYGSILKKESNQLDLFLIYQNPIPQLDISGFRCIQLYDGNGFYCNIGFIFLNDTINYAIKVTFLSNGKIIETERNTDIDLNNVVGFNTFALKSGGIIFVALRYVSDGCDIFGYLLGYYNNITTHVDVPCENLITDSLDNNTALVVQDIKYNSWTLLSIDLPNIMIDKGYDNPMINWTIPTINETISTETTQIQVAYNIPIKCSSQNISIYQKIDNINDILRETYSGESNNCQVISDNTTLSLAVLSSTFNQPNAIYYVKIDENFVKQNKTLEPLLGISKYQWIFFTGPHYYEIDDSINAFVRLTPNATLYFNNLTFKEKSNFFQILTSQIAEIIPIPDNRIILNSQYQIDSLSPSRQILISIKILKSSDNSAISVSTIFDNLSILIKNKETTSISRNDLTSMLDETYGLKEHKTFLELVTIPVIVIGIILFILCICYIWANRRCKEGKNLTIIITTLMLYDFFMDLLFIFDLKSKNLILLFWISILCTIPPIILNLFAAFYVISRENSRNPEFYNYFVNNSTIISICSVMSGADIGVLHILSSNFAGLSIFTAPYSEQAEKYIFWYELIGFCLEDIPQFTVQIIFKSSRVEYTIIPALTLISSSLMLLNNIVGKLYLVIIKCKNLPQPDNPKIL